MDFVNVTMYIMNNSDEIREKFNIGDRNFSTITIENIEFTDIKNEFITDNNRYILIDYIIEENLIILDFKKNFNSLNYELFLIRDKELINKFNNMINVWRE